LLLLFFFELRLEMKNTEAESTDLEIIESQEIARIVPIRTETAISHLPFHRLSNSKDLIQIAMITKGVRGQVTTRWEVSGNSRYGEPGVLAYKLDTLVINRLIDEARPQVPKVLKLGSLSELARELGLGGDTNKIKKALRQNAGAMITAKLEYQGEDGTKRKFEFDDTRYGVVFVGQKLPNGRRADAVYVVFHDNYFDMLKMARTRPLDYAYLKALPPTAQRLYELIAPQIYASLKHGNPRAKYLYSEFCQRASVTRYDEWEKVKKQLYKVHQPHKASGYINKIEFEETTDAAGRIDWLMWYTPGRKAKAEFKRFNTKEGRELDRAERVRPHIVTMEVLPPATMPKKITKPTLTSSQQELFSSLTTQGITESKAFELATNHEEATAKELEALAHRDKKKIQNLAGFLISAIESGDYTAPTPVQRKREAKTLEAQRKQAQEQTEKMRAEYFQFLKAELATLKKKHKDQHKAFSDDFAKFWDRIGRNLQADKRDMLEISHLEKFAEEHADFPIWTFDEWRERQTA
jgi:hypothetical protein